MTLLQRPVVRTTGLCGVCPGACRVEVEIEAGRLVSIRPDDTSGFSIMCKRGHHAPEIVNSEHRLRTPLKRCGKKGTHEFEPTTWDEAYDRIAEGLEGLKRDFGAETICMYTGRGAFEQSLCDMYRPKGIKISSASNILFPFGSPNTSGVGALCYVAFAKIAPFVTMGRELVNMVYDWARADLLVVWGANPATDSPPLKLHRVREAVKRGASIVVIDPRRTETVEETGAEWVPIRPGTDGALALSMLHVLIKEDKCDAEFAHNWCHGFDELAAYVERFAPDRVEGITGIPAEKIRELALRIQGAKSACPVMYTGLEYSNSGTQSIRAALTLFALAGHLDVPGGIGFMMDDTRFPINRSCNVKNPNLGKAIGRDKFPMYTFCRDEAHASWLPQSVLEGKPYRTRGLIVQGASLLTSWPETPVWREMLARLDFLVCIDRHLTADAAYADVVLPATTMFENYSYAVYGSAFRLRERLLEPVGEARNDYLIMAGLAARLGYGHLFPQTEEDLIRFALKGSGYSLEDVEAAGGTVRIKPPPMEYRKWEKGLLRPDAKPGFDTPTGKFEIHSTILEDHGYAPLPEYTEPVEGPLATPELAQQFPLVLNTGARTQTDFRSQHHGVQGLLKENPAPSVQINSVDAEKRGIETGDTVEVRTLRGSVKFMARVSDDIVAGAVECNMGGGGPVGPKEWNEGNVNELTDHANYDPISGFPVYKALLCEVTRVAKAESQEVEDSDPATALAG